MDWCACVTLYMAKQCTLKRTSKTMTRTTTLLVLLLLYVSVEGSVRIVEIMANPGMFDATHESMEWVKVYNSDPTDAADLSLAVFWTSNSIVSPTPTTANVRTSGRLLPPLTSAMLVNGDSQNSSQQFLFGWTRMRDHASFMIAKTIVYLVKPWPVINNTAARLTLWTNYSTYQQQHPQPQDIGVSCYDSVDYFTGPTKGWPITSSDCSIFLVNLSCVNNSIGNQWRISYGENTLTQNCRSQMTIWQWFGIPCPPVECTPNSTTNGDQWCIDTYHDCSQRCDPEYRSCAPGHVCLHEDFYVADSSNYTVPDEVLFIVNRSMEIASHALIYLPMTSNITMTNGGCFSSDNTSQIMMGVGSNNPYYFEDGGQPLAIGQEILLVQSSCVVGELGVVHVDPAVLGPNNSAAFVEQTRECDQLVAIPQYRPGQGIFGIISLDSSGCDDNKETQTIMITSISVVSSVVVLVAVFLVVARCVRPLRQRIFPYTDSLNKYPATTAAQRTK